MISTKESNPQSQSANQFQYPTDSEISSVGVLEMDTRRLVSYTGEVVYTPLCNSQALAIFKQIPEANDKLVSDLQANLQQGKALTDSEMTWVHAWAIDQLEKRYTIEGAIQPSLAWIFFTLRYLHKGCSIPVVHLINSDNQQTIKIFHRTELVKRNPYPGVVQVFYNDKWCGQIRKLNPASSASTSFCRTPSCPEWIEGLLLRFADHPSFMMNEYHKLTGRSSVR